MNSNILYSLFFIFLSVILIRGFITLYLLIKTLKWLKAPFVKVDLKIHDNKQIYVLIPVLREQKRIIQTLNYLIKIFPEKNVKIIVITTQKEYEKNFIGKSTYTLIKDFINLKQLNQKISLLNYPNKKGFMAHQLNYALNKINDDSYLMIYNADSRPHPKTLKIFFNLLQQYPNANIFQQSAIFLKNFEDLNKYNFVKRNFLQTSAILQTRWTLTHEMPRLIRQSLSKNKLFINYANAHCVGHGLIIKTRLLKSIKGFPTEGAITEDLFLGYILKSLGHKIYPFPFLELADSPESMKGLWNQKYIWFWGVFNYLKYYRFVINKFRNYPFKKTKLIVYLIQGYLSSFAWLLSGPLIFFSFIIAFWSKNVWLIILCLISFIVYGPIQYFIIGKNIQFLYQKSGNNYSHLKLIKILNISLMSFPSIIFNSLPTYQTIIAEIRNRIFNVEINKPKTDE